MIPRLRHFIRRGLMAFAACGLAVVTGGSRSVAEGAHPEEGLPLLRHFAAKDHKANPNCGGIALLSDGTIVSGSASLLTFHDGTEWARLDTLGSLLRCVAVMDDDSVVTGGADMFGVAKRDARGRWEWRRLNPAPPDGPAAVGVVSRVAVRGREAWFSGSANVFRWDGKGVRWWAFTNAPAFANAFVVGDAVYLHREQRGLLRLEGDDFVPAVTDGVVTTNVVGDMCQWNGEPLLMTRRKGLYRLRGSRVEAVSEALNRDLERTVAMSVRPLRDGSLLLATATNGLWHLDAQGRMLSRYGRESGLPTDRVHQATEDRHGNWWMATDQGIVVMDLPGAATVFDARNGLEPGSAVAIVRHEGRIVLSQPTGLQVLQAGAGAARIVRHPQDFRSPQAMVSRREGLVVGGVDGIEEISGGARRHFLKTANRVYAMIPSATDPDLIFAGRADGFSVFRRRPESGWTEEAHLPGLGEVRNLHQMPDGAVWTDSTSRGVHRIVPGPGGTWTNAVVTTWSTDNGRIRSASTHSMLFRMPDGLMVAVFEDMLRFRSDPPVLEAYRGFSSPLGPIRFVANTLPAGPDLAWGAAALSQDSEAAELPLCRLHGRGDGGWSIEALPAAIGEQVGFSGALALFRETPPEGEVLWVRGIETLLRIEPARLLAAPTNWTVALTAVSAAGTNQPLAGPLATLPNTRERYVFQFAGVRTDRAARVRYQTRLVGWDDRWSVLSGERVADWSVLPGGTYRFEVRGVDSNGYTSGAACYAFQVAPPWHLSAWAWTAYAAAFIGSLQGLSRLRARQAENRARVLESVVELRTRELAAARDAAESANRAKSRFLATMSHELRTPLNGILGFARILEREPGQSDRNRERLRIIGSSGDHLLGLINDVLDLARVEAGRLELRPSPFRPADLLGELGPFFSHRAQLRGLVFTVDAPGLDGVTVSGDPQRLRQVLENLVGNAVKFTREGQVTLAVARSGADEWEFSVADTGPGMTPRDLDCLFLPFSQAVEGRPAEPGAGLGLAISQHLVGLMGGRIAVTSEPGRGSCFRFTVRLPALDAVAPGRGGVSGISGYEGARRRVLVVDDIETNRRLLRELLEPLGFQVAEAADGTGALAQAGEPGEGPDIVLLDLRMPGMDGFELTRRLRALPGFRGRIVAATASVLGFNREDATTAGAHGVLPKPFREPELFSVLEQQLGLRWIRHSAEGPAPAIPGHPASGPGAPGIPEDELSRLGAAANRGDVAAVHAALETLMAAHPEAAEWLRELDALARSYRMTSLRSRISVARANDA